MRAKATIAALAVLASALALQAQSLKDNVYYQKSLELAALADRAFEEGDYDAATRYAAEAKENAGLSDRYVEKMLARAAAERSMAAAKERLAWAEGIDAARLYAELFGKAKAEFDAAREAFDAEGYAEAKERADRVPPIVEAIAIADADGAIAAAKDRMAWAEGVGAPKRYPGEYGRARSSMDAALAAYGRQDWGEAAAKARAAVAALAMVQEEKTVPLPATYAVRLIPGRRDCLWRIAEYSFVYGNPLKWGVLYEANKRNFRDPSNPNLIFPGQVLKIPSIAGEDRQGAYDPAVEYPAFPGAK